ncbi:MAG: carboxypeptidase-like regulatory domain-containing protein, partial [Paludibacter sp.]
MKSKQMKVNWMKLIFFLILFNTIALSNVNAQCVIRGKVTDINGEVPIGVTIYLKSDNTVGSLTGINGEYSLKVNSALTQVFVISYVGYKKIEDTIRCTKGEVIIKNYVLEPTATTLNAVTILGKTQNNFDAHMEAKKKLSSNTLDFISAETIKKTV